MIDTQDVFLKFDPEEPAHTDIIRLMAAVNDIQRANRLMIAGYDPPPNVAAIAFDKESRGYRVYLIRLVCGHLREGLSAFRKLAQDPFARQIISRWDGEKKRIYQSLFKASDPSDKNSFFKKDLGSVRDFASFHYPSGKFEQQLKKLSEESKDSTGLKIILGKTYAESYYQCADDIICNIIQDEIGGGEESFKNLIIRVRDLGGELTTFLDYFLSEVISPD